MTKILPVIHHIDRKTTLEQAALAREAGAHGVFLISHHGADAELPKLAQDVQREGVGCECWDVGINLLHTPCSSALRAAHQHGLEMVWMDAPGINGGGATSTALRLVHEISGMKSPPEVFASVAFKYQPFEPNAAAAARNAQALRFIPTTSGEGTGKPPTLEKIATMSMAVGGRLAVASGMDIENVAAFAPYLSHILVATGVSVDEHHFDFELLSAFVARAAAGRPPA